MADSNASTFASPTADIALTVRCVREILENIRKTSRPSRPESITDQDARLYAEIGAGIIDEFLDVQDADDVWSELLRGPCIREIFLACDGYKDGDDDDDGGDGSKNENKNENKNDCDTLIVIYVCRDTLLLDSFRDFARRADKLLCRKCSKSKYKDALAIWQAALDQYDRTGVMTTEERAACDARARSKEPNMKKPATFERWALRMWRELHDLKRPSDPAEIEKKVDNANMSTAGWTKNISQRVDIIATTTPALAPERAQANTPPPKYLKAVAIPNMPMADIRVLMCFFCDNQVDCPAPSSTSADTALAQMAVPNQDASSHCGCGDPDPARIDGVEIVEEGLRIMANQCETIESAKSKDIIENTPYIISAPDTADGIVAQHGSVNDGSPAKPSTAAVEVESTGLTAATRGVQARGVPADQAVELEFKTREESRAAVADAFGVNEARGKAKAAEEDMVQTSNQSGQSSAEPQGVPYSSYQENASRDLERAIAAKKLQKRKNGEADEINKKGEFLSPAVSIGVSRLLMVHYEGDISAWACSNVSDAPRWQKHICSSWLVSEELTCATSVTVV
ncbi:hypothetical protein CLAFUW4_13564 [Fulvia fulva]|nr:hypothetical protein CLAFUR4_13566 [Fulvia fulva]WPV22254.1 hypothetical protein CLAFUW4_13564 [Fulvia fulva]WPV37273.1 hypothetical protein CLAFUW7_13571 [Fulvia fulva]